MTSSTSAAGSSSGCAGICTNSTRPTWCPPERLDRAVCTSTGSAAGSPAAQPRCRCGRPRAVVRCRSLTRTIVELDRNSSSDSADGAGAARAARLRRVTAAKLLAEIGPIDRFRRRRAARPPRRRRTARSKLRQDTTPPPRPRRQPPTQRRALPDRDHPGPLPPAARAYLERKQAEGKSRREAIRCLKRHLARVVFNTLKNEPRLDIGATLAQESAHAPRRGWRHHQGRGDCLRCVAE